MRGRIEVAMTVLHDNAMDAIQVKDHVVEELRRVGAVFASTMAKLDYITKGGEGHRFEERTIPPLVQLLVMRGGKNETTYFNGMEWK